MVKVVAKPIEMVSWTDSLGNIHPIRFRYIEKDESYRIVKIDRVAHKELEKLCGNHILVYRCYSTINGQQKIFEIKYELGSCKWILFKI